jgi:hypothetical protein
VVGGCWSVVYGTVCRKVVKSSLHVHVSQDSHLISKMDLINDISATSGAFRQEEDQSFLLHVIGLITTFTNKYIMGFAIIIGILGNILSIVVFARCKKRDMVTVTYLTPLAYADLITLLYGAYSWLVNGLFGETAGYFFIEPRFSLIPLILCKCVSYIYRTSSCVSSYILVLFSCERCLGVWCPIKVHLIATRGRRVKAISITCILQLFLNSPILVYFTLNRMSGTNKYNCYFFTPSFSVLEKYFLDQIIDKVLPLALPCLLILTLSIVIMVGLRRARMERAGITGEIRSGHSSLISLLLISLLYIMSTIPYVSVWPYFGYVRSFVSHDRQKLEVLYMTGMFTTSFSMMNYSFNFLIYSFTLKIYKEELISMFLFPCSPSKCRKFNVSR